MTECILDLHVHVHVFTFRGRSQLVHTWINCCTGSKMLNFTFFFFLNYSWFSIVSSWREWLTKAKILLKWSPQHCMHAMSKSLSPPEIYFESWIFLNALFIQRSPAVEQLVTWYAHFKTPLKAHRVHTTTSTAPNKGAPCSSSDHHCNDNLNKF
jgi:hypothetical protein